MERRLIGPWGRLVRAKEDLLERLGRNPVEALDRRPTAAVWSLADVVEHLVLVEHGVRGGLARAPSPERPRVVASGRWLRFVVLRLVLRGGFRIKAPIEAVLPTRELPWPALLSRWGDERRALEEWLLSADPTILGDPRFRHPIVGWLDVPQALVFAADHLEHHIRQVERIERLI